MRKSLALAATAAALSASPLAQAQQPPAAAASVQPAHQNPLLKPSPLPLQYPAFDQIRDEDFAPALDQGMSEQLAEMAAIASDPEPATFENTIVPMERSGRLLARTSAVLFNLLGADANPARLKLQAAYAAKLAQHRDAISLNPRLFARIQALFDKRQQLGVDGEAQRLIERYHSNFVRAGAQLDEAQKTRIKAINIEMAELGARFNQNVLAEVNASAVVVDTAAELAGLSATEIAEAAAAAKARGLDGKYVIALLNTTTQPGLAQLQNRALRERLYKASIARGSRGNEFDNTAIVARTARLRAERAQLLGFATHADFVLKEETAKNTAAVNGMLGQLAPAAVAAARREAAELQAMIHREQAAAKQPSFRLEAWDWGFYAEKLRSRQYGFDESQLKPYLEMKTVLERGVFHAASQLYGLSFKQRRDLPVYHPSVLVYDVYNADGSHLALFMADLYARPSKRGGAWATSYVGQSKLLDTKPVAAIHLNVPPPAEGQPTLMSWDEVNTLFHEFGHALHGMFSDVQYPSLAGTAVPRDFVEYPSQVNEMWADWPSVLANYARHYQSGDPMPQSLLDKMAAARKFDQGYATASYLSAAIVDQRWHQLQPAQVPAAADVMAFEADVLKREGLDFAPVPPRYRMPYFSHIMGGYAAGYYAYIWSEVLDANTVDWFKQHGGLKRENGDIFRATLLSRGGSEDALQLFNKLTGHAPQIEPLLERRGLTIAPEAKPAKAAQP
ncbi:M3 family metallopeptidase [Paucibacter sp. APW11]|uniref:M3 family metallopeptidase n=1 Tax=Roseateles aquae TaxID=3077235 RepID=A0ABU3PHP6_9BURK|nr:M3 family metallopeptidase [Paucibacter sp. APW11]MDT9001887.1 M3 family metallopeptidase [Paucibacter sp. APW11]